MDTLDAFYAVVTSLEEYDAARRDLVGKLQHLIFTLKEDGKTLESIHDYLASNPFTILGIPLAREVIDDAIGGY